MELSDGVICVRTPVEEDAASLAAVVQSSLRELAPWLPWATADYGVEQALSWIRGEEDPGHPGVIVAPDGQVVGTAGLNLVNEVNKYANLGYFLSTSATGNGWASRSTRLLARHGIEELGLNRLEILMSVENEPSRMVAERGGASYEGVLRGRLLLHGRFHDAHMYSVVPADLA